VENARSALADLSAAMQTPAQRLKLAAVTAPMENHDHLLTGHICEKVGLRCGFDWDGATRW
jgi:hypothetical protein